MGTQSRHKSKQPNRGVIEINIVWVILFIVFVIIGVFIVEKLGNIAKPEGAVAPKEVINFAGYPLFVTVSLRGDILGDLEHAKVVLVEFSDFACPVCQEFAVSYLPRFKEELIDTGKMAHIGRYYIAVPSHKPVALLAINFVECIKQSQPDIAIFTLKDKIFRYLKANGADSSVDKLKNYLVKLGQHLKVDTGIVNHCLDADGKYLQAYEEDARFIDDYVAKITLPKEYKELMQIPSYVMTLSQRGIGTPFYIVCPKGTVDFENNQCTGMPILGLPRYEQFKKIINDFISNN